MTSMPLVLLAFGNCRIRLFEDIIASNAERGFQLGTWRFSQVGFDHGLMTDIMRLSSQSSCGSGGAGVLARSADSFSLTRRNELVHWRNRNGISPLDAAQVCCFRVKRGVLQRVG